jgi:hypothetical protein
MVAYSWGNRVVEQPNSNPSTPPSSTPHPQLLVISQDKVAIDVLVVDDSILYRVELNGLRSRVTRIVAGNHASTPIRVVTTVPVVHSIGQLDVRVAESIEKGLLEIEKSGTGGNLKPTSKARSSGQSPATATR